VTAGLKRPSFHVATGFLRVCINLGAMDPRKKNASSGEGGGGGWGGPEDSDHISRVKSLDRIYPEKTAGFTAETRDDRNGRDLGGTKATKNPSRGKGVTDRNVGMSEIRRSGIMLQGERFLCLDLGEEKKGRTELFWSIKREE